jgi:hypothetical protein
MVMPEGKSLLQIAYICISIIAILCAMILSCVLQDKDIFISTSIVVAFIGFMSYMGDLWD